MSKIVNLKNGLLGEENPVQLAAQLLNKGEVIGVPTDTIYGIAGLAQNSSAVKQIYSIKGRDPLKPIAICVANITDIKTYAQAGDRVRRPLEYIAARTCHFSIRAKCSIEC